ncbi:DUF1501 domain-containing protein [Armatimonas rosea]|uniref:DUF1501 domain-containing protein n=1 Tax=Armatimonas rosea TaxID=685828 RepID=A0A7W9W3W5_ARMRO|nr:DUF1501 domain-containing protein [Armatimonas rosea]MBB6048814.1 hypothetical protein [Armatimonas rosea]
MQNSLPNRRHFLTQAAGGLGSIALAALLVDEASASPLTPARRGDNAEFSFSPPRRTGAGGAAKRVIQIFCCGGVSHLDTFDYKPELIKRDGQECKKVFDTFFAQPGNLMKSPFAFKQHGKSGRWVSELLPHIAERVDDITFLSSMKAKSANHTPATFQMNSGFTLNGFPCLGAWLSYGLGTLSQDLPAFVVLPDPRGLPAGGAINWTSGFLPATHQGTAFNPKGQPVDNLFPPDTIKPADRQAALGLLGTMNQEFGAAHPGDSALAARIKAYELAARMQTSIPQVVAFDQEPEHIKKLYGLDDPIAGGFGRNCLLARRLLEKGVRFVQLYHGGAFGSPRINWDAHEDITENHTKQARSMDQPVAALLTDLKQRGMLDDTLILWTTEFGRTPITQGIGKTGRDHHHLAYTCWMAGAGLKPGVTYGATDEIGYDTAENPVTVYDFHATVLHLLGIDHTKLTYPYGGRNYRLTDVHGEVIRGILS